LDGKITEVKQMLNHETPVPYQEPNDVTHLRDLAHRKRPLSDNTILKVVFG
jgi:hypothetical protein